MSKVTNAKTTIQTPKSKGMNEKAKKLLKEYNEQISIRLAYESEVHKKGVDSKVFYDISAGDRYMTQVKTTDYAARVLTDINVGFINERERENSRTYAKSIPMFARIASALALGAEPSSETDANQKYFGQVLGGNAFAMLIGTFYLFKKHGIKTVTRDDLIAMQSTKADNGIKGKMKQSYRSNYSLGTASSHASMFAIALRALGLAETTLEADGKKVKTLQINFNHKALKWLNKYMAMIEKSQLPQKLGDGQTTYSIVSKAA